MAKTRVIVVGTGGMSRHHIKGMIARSDTAIVGCVEVAEPSIELAQNVFAEAGLKPPPFFPSLVEARKASTKVDAAFIVTPHKFHYEQARRCLEAGMDVLLEKPMVLNASEARRLIQCRDKTGRLLVVAFPGSLSPAIRKAGEMLRAGALGKVSMIAAQVHQHWMQPTANTWRQDPALSGGGFLFDTGSHMINTVVDLAGSDVAQVMAMLDNRGCAVEIVASVSGSFQNEVIFSLAAAGDSTHCSSLVSVFGSEGVLQTGIWGEFLRLRRRQDATFQDVPVPSAQGVWGQFLQVRAGRMANPCPPEVGLRFAKLMDMIHKSAQSGRLVKSRRPAGA